MNINYQLTNSDFLEYQLYASSKSETHKKSRNFSKILLPVLFLLFGFLLYKKEEDDIGTLLISGVTATLWFIFYPIYSKWLYKKKFKKHVEKNYRNQINKPVEIDFNENSVNVKDFMSETKINGTELKELIETKSHFFIKLTTDVSLIVPKHSIENQTEFKNRVTELGAEYVDEINWEWK